MSALISNQLFSTFNSLQCLQHHLSCI